MPAYQSPPQQPSRLFSDIQDHWASACIRELADRKWITGNPDGQFRPDDVVTRAEFATLMYWVFPDSLPVRQPQTFVDVPGSHWAWKTVQWVYERGFFSGYSPQRFAPNVTLTRSQALIVLMNGLHYAFPLMAADLLDLYFDDAAEIPSYARGAIAAAILAELVVNYPDVRKLRPQRAITRGEVAALLCQVLGRSHTIPQQYIPWSQSLETFPNTTLPFNALKSNPRLVKQIQTKLHALRLHPGDDALDGRYSPTTEAALIELCRLLELPNRHTYSLDQPLATLLLNLEPTCFLLQQASDRDWIFDRYWQQAKEFDASHLAFLDQGIEGSPYEPDIPHYPTYLLRKTYGHSRKEDQFKPFPKRGVVPEIETDDLTFLHDDMVQACVCIGQFIDGQLRTRWLGRNALTPVELWSATKIIPLLNLAAKVNANFVQSDLDRLLLRAKGSRRQFRLYDLVVDMINYQSKYGSSNSLAAMLKQFETPQNLERWLQQITGNTKLIFRGRYGEGAFIRAPELWDPRLRRVVLKAGGGGKAGNNSISTYDLTRLVTMLVWHGHLPPEAQLPGSQWHSLESVIRAMGKDSARYIDIAIAQLGLDTVIESPVIISKLGFGYSGIRKRTELVYTAYVQFIQKQPCTKEGRSPLLRSIGMTLVGAKKLGNGDREATELDARMAAEVTEILRRVVTQAL